MEETPQILENEPAEDVEPVYAPDDSMFASAGLMSDVTLLVEGRVLHVSRCVLSLASPVFRNMMEGEFKDKGQITLVDKMYNDMVELLLCIYPSTTKIITKFNLETVLSLADEYKMESLKERCGQILLQQLQHDQRYNKPTNEQLVHFLYLADKYQIEALIEESIKKGKSIYLDGDNGLESFPEYQELSVEVKYRICSARLSSLEVPLKRLIISGRNVQHISDEPASETNHVVAGFGHAPGAGFGTGGFSFGTITTSPAEQLNKLSKMVKSLSKYFHNDPTL